MRRAAPVEAALAARPVPWAARPRAACRRRSDSGAIDATVEQVADQPRARVLAPHIAQRAARPGAFLTAWLRLSALLLAFVLAAPAPVLAATEHIEVTALEIVRDEDGLFLNYGVEIDLSRSVEDALNKGVPLFFVAEAQVYRDRWYWRDRRVGDAVRVWRLAYQPLTSSYRVTFGALSQNYSTRTEALAAISRASRWRIAEAGQVEPDSHHYMEFSFRLDTNLLPRPMQIGVGGQAEWQLSVRRTVRIN
jgi:hypothetical protein